MMHPLRKKRLWIVAFILIGTSLATGLALYALNQNINLYYTPSQVKTGKAPRQQVFRMGGLVEKHSIDHRTGLRVDFTLTDTAHHVRVQYDGILPDLFRTGQGVVVQGYLNQQDILVANQVLAKHGAKYMPKPAKDAIQQAKKRYQTTHGHSNVSSANS